MTTSSSSSHIERLINSNYHPSPSKPIYSDRFIPSRSSSNFHQFNISTPLNEPSSAYVMRLRAALFGPHSTENENIFRYKTETRLSLHPVSLFPSGFLSDDDDHHPAPPTRKIPSSHEIVLDVPKLKDDFYADVVDWSSQNIIAVGLGSKVYVQNKSTAEVTELCNLETDHVQSLAWAQCGTNPRLAVGTKKGKVQIWDVSSCKKVRTMQGHGASVGALAWNHLTPYTFSSAGKDRMILQRDSRLDKDFVSILRGHGGSVCGLKWSYDDRKLASGGDDDRLLIWNRHSTKPVLEYSQHQAGVKAIAWSPHREGLLASGGGTADKCIRFWNTNTDSQSQLSCIETGSQVCKLAWSKNVDELVSTHGFQSNQIIVWEYPSLSKLGTLTGHSNRVLYLATSPDGQTIVTGAGDETLRFWNVFPPKPKYSKPDFRAFHGRTIIR